MLLTRSRLCPRPKPGSSLHLHVLGTPPAFVLSQDQTLREELLGERPKIAHPSQRVVRDTTRVQATTGRRLRGQNPGPVPGGIRPLRPSTPPRSPRTQRAPERKTGSILAPPPISPCGPASDGDRTWTHLGRGSAESAHAVEFSKTVAPLQKGFLRRHAREPKLSRGGPVSIARNNGPGKRSTAPQPAGPTPGVRNLPPVGFAPLRAPATLEDLDVHGRRRGRSSKSIRTNCCHVPS